MSYKINIWPGLHKIPIVVQLTHCYSYLLLSNYQEKENEYNNYIILPFFRTVTAVAVLNKDKLCQGQFKLGLANSAVVRQFLLKGVPTELNFNYLFLTSPDIF